MIGLRLLAATLALGLMAGTAFAAPRHRSAAHHTRADAQVSTATYRVSSRHPAVRIHHAVLGTRRGALLHRRTLLSGN